MAQLFRHCLLLHRWYSRAHVEQHFDERVGKVGSRQAGASVLIQSAPVSRVGPQVDIPAETLGNTR